MDEFIEVEKDGEQNIWVHPLALEDHKRLGWKVVGEVEPEAEAAPAEKTEESGKSRVRRRVGTTVTDKGA